MAKCNKTIAWNEDTVIEEHSSLKPRSGQQMDLITAALKQLNCELSVVRMPWARALQELENGRIDMMAGANKTEERQRYAWYSELAFYTRNVVFVRLADKNTLKLSHLSDFTRLNLKIGTQINAVYGAEFTALMANKAFARTIYPNTSRRALWEMLHLGRLDGVVSEVEPALVELRYLNLADEIGHSELEISKQASYFIFSKLSTAENFVRALDQHLIQLNTRGENEAQQPAQ